MREFVVGACLLFVAQMASAKEIHFELVDLNTAAPSAELWDGGTHSWVGLTDFSTALSGGEPDYRRHRYTTVPVTDADTFYVRLAGSDESIFATADLSGVDYSGANAIDFYVDFRFGGSVVTLWYDATQQFHVEQTNFGLTPVPASEVYTSMPEPSTGVALLVAVGFISLRRHRRCGQGGQAATRS